MSQSSNQLTSFTDALGLPTYNYAQLGWQGGGVLTGLRRAYKVAEQSTDPSTHVGACLHTEATLYQKDFWLCQCNHLVKGVSMQRRDPRDTDDDIDLQDDVDYTQYRMLKYERTCHAQASVLSMAGRMGTPTRNAVLYAPWAACIPCAKLIIEADLYCVWVHKQALDRTPYRWKTQVTKAHQLMKKAGVLVKAYDGVINSCTSLMDGQKWNP